MSTTSSADRMPVRSSALALQARAYLLYPNNPYLQDEWIRAVGVVRSTKGGWVMDIRAERVQ